MVAKSRKNENVCVAVLFIRRRKNGIVWLLKSVRLLNSNYINWDHIVLGAKVWGQMVCYVPFTTIFHFQQSIAGIELKLPTP